MINFLVHYTYMSQLAAELEKAGFNHSEDIKEAWDEIADTGKYKGEVNEWVSVSVVLGRKIFIIQEPNPQDALQLDIYEGSLSDLNMLDGQFTDENELATAQTLNNLVEDAIHQAPHSGAGIRNLLLDLSGIGHYEVDEPKSWADLYTRIKETKVLEKAVKLKELKMMNRELAEKIKYYKEINNITTKELSVNTHAKLVTPEWFLSNYRREPRVVLPRMERALYFKVPERSLMAEILEYFAENGYELIATTQPERGENNLPDDVLLTVPLHKINLSLFHSKDKILGFTGRHLFVVNQELLKPDEMDFINKNLYLVQKKLSSEDDASSEVSVGRIEEVESPEVELSLNTDSIRRALNLSTDETVINFRVGMNRSEFFSSDN